jgi:hypothetical protein
MANTASSLSANGSLTISGSFDEVTYNPTSNVRVNLISHSQDFTQTSQWAALSGLSVTSPGEIAPDLTRTAQLFTGNGVTTGYLNTTFPWVAGRTYTFSCYFKAGTLSVVSIYLYGIYFGTTGTGGTGCDFNLNTITTIPFGGATATIQSVGNGWFRCSLTTQAFNTRPIGDIGCQAIRMSAASGTLYAWGYQIEESNAVTTYVTTGTNAVILANNASKLVPLSTNNSTLYIKGEFNEVDYNPNNIGPTRNLFPNSQDLAQNYNWLGASNITKNADVAPDGTRTANLYTGTGLYPRIQYWPLGNVAARGFGTPGKYYTQSLFVKYVNQQYCVFVTENWPSPYGGAVRFDLLTGTVGSTGGSITNATITRYDNGWYRISATWLIPSTKIYTDSTGDVFYWQVQWRLGNYDGTDYTGQKMLLWGYQLEEGNTATTYLATDFPKNLLLYSEDLANTNNWSKDNCILSRNTTVDPNGNFTGQMLTSTITGGYNNSFVNQQLYFLPINTNYTFSVYVKQGTSPTTNINFYNVSPFSETNAIVTWPTIPGNKPTVTYTTGSGGVLLANSFTESTNGWWRVSLSLYNGSSSSLICRVYTTTNSTTNVNGYNVYVWGAQLEFGLVATPYISNPNGGQFGNILPLANTNIVMKTINTGNTFIKGSYDEFNKNISVTDGLIMYLDAAKYDSYQGTGNVWIDMSGSRNHASLNNIVYEGANDAFLMTGSVTSNIVCMNLSSYSALTIDAWFWFSRSVGNANEQDLWTYNGNPAGSTMGGSLTFQSSNFRTDRNGVAGRYYPGASAPRGQWFRFCYVKDGNGYINQTQYTSSGTDNPYGPLIIGQSRSDVNMPFLGKIGHIKIYNRSLTQSEIDQNFTDLRSRFGV